MYDFLVLLRNKRRRFLIVVGESKLTDSLSEDNVAFFLLEELLRFLGRLKSDSSEASICSPGDHSSPYAIALFKNSDESTKQNHIGVQAVVVVIIIMR